MNTYSNIIFLKSIGEHSLIQKGMNTCPVYEWMLQYGEHTLIQKGMNTNTRRKSTNSIHNGEHILNHKGMNTNTSHIFFQKMFQTPLTFNGVFSIF